MNFFIIILAIVLIVIKIYMLRKLGIKRFFRQKLIMVSVIATISGILWLSVPGFVFQNPKEIISSYLSEF